MTKILTFLAQASHEMVPPEVAMIMFGIVRYLFLSTQILEPALRCVVNNFVSERNSTEAMAVG